ncbi:uncharacterized protein [Onthophagus taurus]|uniref:uncharacterized protein n=1 Tax=Onthophagus taurus TaxID=166361 RepID=UPI000C20E5B8|nr:uncharacterized protein LOC111425008 [Onthophagus taurus]
MYDPNAFVNVVISKPKEKFVCPKPAPPETLLAWFDRHCEKELNKHKTQLNVSIDTATAVQASITEKSVCAPRDQKQKKLISHSVSGIDLACRLRGEQETELLTAVEKLAKAEAMVAFEGAVRAAEDAATRVPPEFAEEAAAATVRSYQAELTEVVKEVLPGTRPIEVVGYVGITRPKNPAKTAYTFNG